MSNQLKKTNILTSKVHKEQVCVYSICNKTENQNVWFRWREVQVRKAYFPNFSPLFDEHEECKKSLRCLKPFVKFYCETTP